MQGNWRLCALGVLAGFVLGSMLCEATAVAQSSPFGKLRGLGGNASSDAGGAVVQASAKVLPADKDHPARLQITAKIEDGWHIYSITQPPGGPVRTKIKIAESPAYKLGEFKAVTPPKSHIEPLFDNLVVEEHEGTVVWEAPLTAADPGAINIVGAVNAQACKDSCLAPTDYKFAVVGGAKQAPQQPAAIEPANLQPAAGAPQVDQPPTSLKTPEVRPAPGALKFRRDESHADLTGRIEPESVAPGGTARLTITTAPEPPFHLYAYATEDTREIGRGKPTLIQLKPTAGLSFDPPTTTAPLLSQASTIAPVPVERYYSGAVTWTIEVRVASDATPGEYPIEGVISYQTCKSGDRNATCDPPGGARFVGVLLVGEPREASASVGFRSARYNEPAAVAVSEPANADAVVAQSPPAARARFSQDLRVTELNATGGPQSSLLTILGLSLLGGLILNLMPCVLPVIGLKILSFTAQAGQSRQRILALNLWYTAGVLVVFMVLATLAAGASLKIASHNLGWGEHFASPIFNVVMSGLVFSMALSFLGIWEIPIPGFVGSGKGTELAAQEGPSGAFFKGVMSTILATPCSGPFLSSVFGFTLTQPPTVIYLVYGAIGIGMASPYLLIGAFPALVKWLPKPGAWMETFKQIMGFVLLGTVIYLLSVLDERYWVATLTLLLGLGFACWWIGRTPIYAELPKRLAAWGQAAAIAAAIGYFGFTALVTHKSELSWQPFAVDKTTQLAMSGKTVMIDFTASWCPTCQLNMKVAIDTPATKELVQENGIVPLLADWSDWSDEIREALNALHHNEIPVLAIFPAGHPEEAFVLAGVISQGELLEALRRAGPSVKAEPGSAATERLTAVEGAGAAN